MSKPRNIMANYVHIEDKEKIKSFLRENQTTHNGKQTILVSDFQKTHFECTVEQNNIVKRLKKIASCIKCNTRLPYMVIKRHI